MAPSCTATRCVLPIRHVLQELLQCMCFLWGMVPQEQTAPHGSSMGLRPVRKPASLWVSAQTAVSHLLWCGPSWPAGEQSASPWSFHRPCRISSASWNISSHSFFTDLGVCRGVSTMFFSLLLQHSFKTYCHWNYQCYWWPEHPLVSCHRDHLWTLSPATTTLPHKPKTTFHL